MKNILLIITILTAPFAQAQEKEKSIPITFKVARFDPTDRPPPQYSLESGSSFKVPKHNLSKPINGVLREGKYLDLTRNGALNSVVIPLSMRENLLLIFIPNKGGFKPMPIHIPTNKIGGGSRLLVNATGEYLKINFGKQKARPLKHSSRLILKPSRSDSMIPVIIYAKKDEKWKLVRSDKWYNDKRFRSFVFLYKKPGSNQIHAHAIPERIDRPKAKR